MSTLIQFKPLGDQDQQLKSQLHFIAQHIQTEPYMEPDRLALIWFDNARENEDVRRDLEMVYRLIKREAALA